MPAIKNTKSVKEFLPASFKLQQEKEAQAAENRKSFNDGPGLYLRAPKEGKHPKTGKPEPGSVEFRVMSECVFGFSLWYDTEDGGRAIKRWLAEDLIARGIEGGEIPADEIPEKCARYDKSKKPKITKFLAMVVYNITASQEDGQEENVFQIWDLDKATMIEQFANACSNPRFGHPTGYDFIWSRTGEMQATKHTLQAQPPYELPAEVMADYAEVDVDLKAHGRGQPIDEVWGHIEKKED